jgi:hypothetical protein
MGSRVVAKNGERIREFVEHFPKYVSEFDQNPPFSDEQLRFHLATVGRRQALSTALQAVGDKEFLRLLYQTLKLWRMDQRKAEMVPFDDFAKAFRSREKEVSSLESYSLEDANLDAPRVADALWNLVTSLRISKTHAKLVSSTKALHHLLPKLVVPMDRAFTGAFLGWNAYNWQTAQERSFKSAFGEFARIALLTRPSQFVGEGWRTSGTKIIDNAIVGFCRSHRLDRSSLAELGKKAQAMGRSVHQAPAAQPTATAVLNALVEKREDIKRFGVRSLGLFGSAARGEATPASDLDFLVELEKPSFDTYMGLLEYLEELFGHPVDLVLANTIKPRLRESILREAVHAQGL